MGDKPDSDPLEETQFPAGVGSWVANAKLVLEGIRGLNKKLDDLAKTVDRVERDMNSRMDGHDSRLREVENKQREYDAYKKGRDSAVVHMEQKTSLWVIALTTLMGGSVIVIFQWIAQAIFHK